MKKIYKKIIPPLSLLLTKGKKSSDLTSTIEINVCKGSKKVGNTEMAVIPHYKPIVKLSV
ncbi:hypothetical protein [Sinomicrobium weinanense]|uniref:Uncharacterized protein n=1 Tax=Sinomicrobium weinanense TaxID=2842200 RepID=A0A926JW48_9FLAO|nr:hypothetical protein [Sinomicrobium weinanense]MBC9798466.1 hypothetical protein [Sinomicrobium weinanense]MBU3126007.1 hypothetical protein [Sinomicrobium weinanense]